ncbi:hypothetical protein [Glaciimonas immobilis]|uniref:Uncharacterized protein n=1 Tax=Glaciimonas immobilis TaxID=728004 RepID=A0A840RVG4_9BURK|nr:hypothetical protein [Glaciimonas immobilis]KAF3999938.1 hypothetical protein HAV38_01820 [Glaciimonas immobilis]MBB5200439.1 hypothetical protein [Glaciimonas immobilis]
MAMFEIKDSNDVTLKENKTSEEKMAIVTNISNFVAIDNIAGKMSVTEKMDRGNYFKKIISAIFVALIAAAAGVFLTKWLN